MALITTQGLSATLPISEANVTGLTADLASKTLSVTFSVTAAEIKALHSSPKQLLAAPGANKAYQPFAGFCIFTHGATAYTVTGGQSLQVTTAAAAAASDTLSLLELNHYDGVLTGASDDLAAWMPNASSDISAPLSGWTRALWENSPLVLFWGSPGAADPTLGNGTIACQVKYLIPTLP